MANKIEDTLGEALEYEITIQPSSNHGYIVTVGCKKFVFEGRQNLIRALNRYLSAPEQMETDYYKQRREKMDRFEQRAEQATPQGPAGQEIVRAMKILRDRDAPNEECEGMSGEGQFDD